MGDRIIALVDMDCFYVQVEQRQQPQYRNKPCAVVQYNAWQGGGVIAVSYEARACGVSGRMRGDVAKKKCPEIHLFQVPELRGKANLTRYRDASVEVMDVLCEFGDCMERASIDEAFLDLTRLASERASSADAISEDLLPNTFVAGYDTLDSLSHDEEVSDDDTTEGSSCLDVRSSGLRRWLKSAKSNLPDLKLAAAAMIVEEMRAAVYERTGFRCSAGISHNKMLAKLACGIHKPNNQTILPKESVPVLFSTISMHKVRSLGGKLGEEIKEKLAIETMGQLAEISLEDLQKHFGTKTGLYLHEVSHGVENEPVISRQLPKSIGCGKNFPGKSGLSTESQVRHWLGQLAEELQERLVKDKKNNRRRATLLTISFRRQTDAYPGMTSRSCPLHIYDYVRITQDAFDLVQKATKEKHSQPIINLSMSAGKFHDSVETIESFLSPNPRETTSRDSDKVARVCVHTSGDKTPEENGSKKRENQKASTKNPKNSVMGFFAKKLRLHTKSQSDDGIEGHSSNSATEKSNSGEEKDKGPSATCEVVDVVSDLLNVEEGNGNSASGVLKAMGEIDESVLPHLPEDIRREVEGYLRNKETAEAGIQKSSAKGTARSEMKETSNLDLPSTSACTNTGIEVCDKVNADDGKDRCHKCQEMVPLEQLEEHADFHFAQELQAQMREEERSGVTIPKPKRTPVKGSTSSSRGKRRGRPPKKQAPTLHVHKKMRKLESYFG